MRDLSAIEEPRLVRAFGHPLRLRILTLLEQSQEASPKSLSDALNEPLGNVSYHVRTLSDVGLIQLVRSAPRRGAVEHFYSLVVAAQPDGAWSPPPSTDRRSGAPAVLTEVASVVNAAARTDGFDRQDAQLNRIPLLLDPLGLAELAKECLGLQARALAIERESATRLARDAKRKAIKSAIVLMLFDGVPQQG
jgi:DNA-binding transcriptional ArsR family regulator